MLIRSMLHLHLLPTALQDARLLVSFLQAQIYSHRLTFSSGLSVVWNADV